MIPPFLGSRGMDSKTRILTVVLPPGRSEVQRGDKEEARRETGGPLLLHGRFELGLRPQDHHPW